MRTAKEIRAYLKQQHWYKDFVRNTKKRGDTSLILKPCIRGYNGRYTITRAFTWYLTSQGHDVWEYRSRLFSQWYDKGRRDKK